MSTVKDFGKATVVETAYKVSGRDGFQFAVITSADGRMVWLRMGWDGPGDPEVGETGRLVMESSSGGSLFRFLPDAKRDPFTKRRP